MKLALSLFLASASALVTSAITVPPLSKEQIAEYEAAVNLTKGSDR